MSTADKRDLILTQLLTILEAIPDQLGYTAHSVFRNRGELKDDLRPAIVLLDGTEQHDARVEGRGRMFMSPNIVTLLPQIFVLLVPRKLPTNLGVGEELNVFRVAIIRAIATDDTLASLCGPNGGVFLRKCDTDMQTGNTLQGQLRMDFAFKYVLDPYSLPDNSVTT
jgi:hypothetical protein